jgi:two-component system response regulator RegA
VIDDDDTFRKRIARAFRDRGLNVLEAAASGEAIEKINANEIDSVVLDLKLGDESGLSLLGEISKISNANVVVLTGYGTIATAVDAVKLGAVNYLTKPVDADTVLAAFQGNSIRPVNPPQLAQVEWEHIQRVLNDNDGNISRASKALGLHRRSLQRKLLKQPTRLR